MQFIITAYDGTDQDALARRMNVRNEHLENMKKVEENAKAICAGGIMNDAGTPIGSFLIMEFASKELFDEYLENEPYMVHGVWKNVKVENCNAVIVNNEMVGK